MKHSPHPREEIQSVVEQQAAKEGDFNESLLPSKSREENQLGGKFPVASVHVGACWMRLLLLCGGGCSGGSAGACAAVGTQPALLASACSSSSSCWHSCPSIARIIVVTKIPASSNSNSISQCYPDWYPRWRWKAEQPGNSTNRHQSILVCLLA